jgi:hypothetical protein
MARDAGCRVAVFSTDDDVYGRDVRVAHAVAQVRGGRILVERGGELHDAGAVEGDAGVAAQVAAALAAHLLEENGLGMKMDEPRVERDGAAVA